MSDVFHDLAFQALITKLKASDDWREHLDEVIAFFTANKPFVVVESPYAAPTEAEVNRNLAYARAACHDALVTHGEIPFASHIKYTQPGMLDDTVAWERALGIGAGLAEGVMARKTAVYVDLGLSEGMVKGVLVAAKAGRAIVLRSLAPYANATHTVAAAKAKLMNAGVPEMFIHTK
jgi:hypothetical protein